MAPREQESEGRGFDKLGGRGRKFLERLGLWVLLSQGLKMVWGNVWLYTRPFRANIEPQASWVKEKQCLSWGCHNTISQTRELKQQTFLFSWFWKPEVQDQCASRSGSGESSPPSLHMATIRIYDHMAFSWYVHVGREGGSKWEQEWMSGGEGRPVLPLLVRPLVLLD